VLEQYPDTVKLVFKNLPLAMHKNAEPAALAAIAAQNQGKFWQMHDALFATAQDLSDANIQAAAKSIGLDMDQFNRDRKSLAAKKRLYKDIADARKAGVNGTPSLFINGRLVKNRSFPALQAMIDRELQASHSAKGEQNK